MKRFILILISIICCNIGIALAQNEAIASLKDSISVKRERLSDNKGLIKKDNKVKDSLINDYVKLVDEYDKFIDKLKVENIGLKSKNEGYEKLLASDTTVFTTVQKVKIEDIPLCLKSHYELIRKIAEIENKINQINEKIVEAENIRKGGWDVNMNTSIKKPIEDLYFLFEEVNAMDMKTLSEEQKKFYRPGLTEQFNELLKYLE